MKRFSINSILAIVAMVIMMTACQKSPQIDLTNVDAFTKAKPVWAEGRQKEKNLILSFREVIKAGWLQQALPPVGESDVCYPQSKECCKALRGCGRVQLFALICH